jgi:subtilase family serine protease
MEQDMRGIPMMRFAPLTLVAAAACAVALLPSAGAQAGPTPAGSHQIRARITGALVPGARISPAGSVPAVTGLPSKKQQIKVLTAVLNNMRKNYSKYAQFTPGPQDIFDYGIGPLWRKGIDGAGTTIAVMEGWNDPTIASVVAGFDKVFGLPNPRITTIFPVGPLPKQCPPGMVALGSYGSCSAWAGELELDVLSAHLMAPYAKIVISATPADSQETDDAASQVAMPEIMKGVEFIASRHLANVISISDGNGESTYSGGAEEITAQNPGELAAAAAGIPVLVGTGDCGVVQNLPVANSQCGNASHQPDTAAWDDSPWVTAVGGTIPNIDPKTGAKVGSDPVWHVGGIFAEGAGYSSVFSRPSYQNGVANITRSPMRSVPDIALDAQDGTSEAGPMLNGVLALATQLNHGRNVGPINPALYENLGPRGAAAGIADVIHGNNSVVVGGKTVVQGFTAAKGFDVATGWGTINGKFVPSLVAATRADGQEAAARRQARTELTALEHGIRFTPRSISKGGMTYLLAGGFLPGHPVKMSIDGKAVATLTVGDLGTVTFMIDPGLLTLAPGEHTVRLSSLLLTKTGRFHIS